MWAVETVALLVVLSVVPWVERKVDCLAAMSADWSGNETVGSKAVHWAGLWVDCLVDSMVVWLVVGLGSTMVDKRVVQMVVVKAE